MQRIKIYMQKNVLIAWYLDVLFILDNSVVIVLCTLGRHWMTISLATAEWCQHRQDTVCWHSLVNCPRPIIDRVQIAGSQCPLERQSMNNIVGKTWRRLLTSAATERDVHAVHVLNLGESRFRHQLYVYWCLLAYIIVSVKVYLY